MSWRSDKRKNKTIEDKRKQVESEESSAMMEESLRKAQEEVACQAENRRAWGTERFGGETGKYYKATPEAMEPGDLALIRNERREKVIKDAEKAVFLQVHKDAQEEQERIRAKRKRAEI